MDVKVKAGFEKFEALEAKLTGADLPVDMDYVKKYHKNWVTATLPKDVELEVKDVNDIVLAQFLGNQMRSGRWTSPLIVGKEYIFGREHRLNNGLYYVSIKPEGTYDKRETGIVIPRNVSRIHVYAADLGNELEIARLGVTPINISVLYEGSNIRLE
jgi:hypothetical protein